MLTWLTERIPPRPVGLTRLLVGVAAVARAFVAWPVLSKLTEPETLRDPYFAGLPDLTMTAVAAFVAVWVLSGIAFAIGWKVGLSGPVLLLTIVATMALDRQAYSNHLYLMAWLVLLLSVADAGAGLNWRRLDREVVRWPVFLLMLQATIVYGFSAVTKVNDEFLTGEVLAGVLRGGPLPFPDSLRTPAFLSAMAVVVIGVELSIALFLWSRHLRPYAFLLGLGLHVSILLFISDTAELAIFGLEMIALYPLFLSTSPLRVTVSKPSWRGRLATCDVLELVDADIDAAMGDITLEHDGRLSTGARAHTITLEHLVPWLWVAPALRLPGVSWAHRRAHRQ